MATNAKDNLLLLFERPTEPAFIPKGDNKVIFDVPLEYLVRTVADRLPIKPSHQGLVLQ